MTSLIAVYGMMEWDGGFQQIKILKKIKEDPQVKIWQNQGPD